MTVSDVAPAAGLGCFVTVALLIAQVLPMGEATVLVRVADGGVAAAAGATDAALVAVPAEGFAVLHGEASRIRRALGLAVVWTALPPCAVRVP